MTPRGPALVGLKDYVHLSTVVPFFSLDPKSTREVSIKYLNRNRAFSLPC